MAGILRRLKHVCTRLAPPAAVRAIKYLYYPLKISRVGLNTEPEMAIVASLVGPGDTVVDIGANIGTYTKVLSRLVGPKGRVFSLEPIPLTCRYLKHNVKTLRLGNVQVDQVAASDQDGSVTMVVPQYISGSLNYYMASILDRPAPEDMDTPSYSVDTRRLDGLLPLDRGLVSFVKCDVEGHELPCLRGAEELLGTDHPAWLVEVSDDPDIENSAAAELFALLKKYGYRAYVYSNERLRARRLGDREVNYFFLTPEHAVRAGADAQNDI